MKLGDGLGRLWPDFIFSCECAEHPPFGGGVQECLSLGHPSRCESLYFQRYCDLAIAQKARSANEDGSAIHIRLRPLARQCIKISSLQLRCASAAGFLDYRLGERVLRIRLAGGGQGEKF